MKDEVYTVAGTPIDEKEWAEGKLSLDQQGGPMKAEAYRTLVPSDVVVGLGSTSDLYPSTGRTVVVDGGAI